MAVMEIYARNFVSSFTACGMLIWCQERGRSQPMEKGLGAVL